MFDHIGVGHDTQGYVGGSPLPDPPPTPPLPLPPRVARVARDGGESGWLVRRRLLTHTDWCYCNLFRAKTSALSLSSSSFSCCHHCHHRRYCRRRRCHRRHRRRVGHGK
jgi:hypothetical protein